MKNHLFKLAVWLGLLLALPVARADSLTNGLVAYYPLDGNANDMSGNGNNGTPVDVVATADRHGNAGHALQLNGTSSQITVPHNLLNIGQAGYTVCLWFNSSDSSKLRQTLFNTAPHLGLAVSYSRGENPPHLSIFVGNGVTTWDINGPQGLKDIYADSWHFVVFSKNGADYTMYVDGNMDWQANHPNTYDQNVPLMFGVCSFTDYPNREWLKGSLDDIRIYSRALSSNEIAQLYAGTAQPITNTVTLHPGAHGSIAEANSGSNYVMSVTNGAAFPAVTVNPAASWTFTGWTPATPATVTNDFEAMAQYSMPPTITTNPVTQTVGVGAGATFTVAATGSPLNYQWYFNGTAISGANGPSLTVSNAAPDAAGVYTVTVWNTLATNTSTAVYLWLNTLKMYAGVNVYGTTGAVCQVQYTTNLNTPVTWNPLQTVTIVTNPTVIIDYGSADQPQRFYQAVPQ